MRKLILFTVFSTFIQVVSAQYCGNSGPSQCIESGTLTQPGLSPMPDSLPPFENNVNSTTVIQFKNFNQVYFGGNPYTVQTLRIDTIDNLPAGLCWASNRVDNMYANSESGCIKVNGIPCDSTGQYKLRIIATVNIGIATVTVDADAYGLRYFVRLKNTGDPTVPVDTMQPASNPFYPYGGICLPALPPSVTLGADQNVCNGSSVTLNPVITDGQPPLSFSWQSVGNSLSCSNCQNPDVTLTQNSTFILTVTDAFNRVAHDTIVYSVIGGGGNFQISASGATTVCRGTLVTLHAAQNISFTNQWQRNGADIPGETDSVYVVTDSSGVYSVAYSSGSCNANSNSITVAVNDAPSVSVTPPGPVGICQGNNVVLQAGSTLTVTYLWQLNGNNLGSATNSSYTALLSGSYRVVVKTTENCTDTSNAVAVTVNPLPSVTLSGNPDTLCTTSGAITLNGGTPSGGTYNGIGVTGSTFNPTASGTGSHVISYTYTDGNTCTNSATETIVVRLCTGINYIEEEGMVLVYPNPAKDKLVIQSDLFIQHNPIISLFDVNGKKQIVNARFQYNLITLNTTSLAVGIYSLKLEINSKEITRKFIKTE